MAEFEKDVSQGHVYQALISIRLHPLNFILTYENARYLDTAITRGSY